MINMNEIIIDSICILEFLLNHKFQEIIQRTVGNSQLVAPECLSYEVGNAVSKLINKGLITVVDGVAVYHELARIPIRFIEPDVSNSIVIAGESGCNAYEAYYVALAQQLSLPLFTLNENMKKIAISRGVKCL